MPPAKRKSSAGSAGKKSPNESSTTAGPDAAAAPPTSPTSASAASSVADAAKKTSPTGASAASSAADAAKKTSPTGASAASSAADAAKKSPDKPGSPGQQSTTESQANIEDVRGAIKKSVLEALATTPEEKVGEDEALKAVSAAGLVPKPGEDKKDGEEWKIVEPASTTKLPPPGPPPIEVTPLGKATSGVLFEGDVNIFLLDKMFHEGNLARLSAETGDPNKDKGGALRFEDYKWQLDKMYRQVPDEMKVGFVKPKPEAFDYADEKFILGKLDRDVRTQYNYAPIAGKRESTVELEKNYPTKFGFLTYPKEPVPCPAPVPKAPDDAEAPGPKECFFKVMGHGGKVFQFQYAGLMSTSANPSEHTGGGATCPSMKGRDSSMKIQQIPLNIQQIPLNIQQIPVKRSTPSLGQVARQIAACPKCKNQPPPKTSCPAPAPRAPTCPPPCPICDPCKNRMNSMNCEANVESVCQAARNAMAIYDTLVSGDNFPCNLGDKPDLQYDNAEDGVFGWLYNVILKVVPGGTDCNSNPISSTCAADKCAASAEPKMMPTCTNKGGVSPSQSSVCQKTSRSSVDQKTSQPSIGQKTSQPSIGQRTSQPSIGQRTSQPSIGQRTSQSSVGQKTSQSSVCQKTSQSSVGKKTSQSSFGKRPTSQSPVGKKPTSRPSVCQKTSQSSCNAPVTGSITYPPPPGCNVPTTFFPQQGGAPNSQHPPVYNATQTTLASTYFQKPSGLTNSHKPNTCPASQSGAAYNYFHGDSKSLPKPTASTYSMMPCQSQKPFGMIVPQPKPVQPRPSQSGMLPKPSASTAGLPNASASTLSMMNKPGGCMKQPEKGGECPQKKTTGLPPLKFDGCTEKGYGWIEPGIDTRSPPIPATQIFFQKPTPVGAAKKPEPNPNAACQDNPEPPKPPAASDPPGENIPKFKLESYRDYSAS